MATSDWSRVEVEAIVADYLNMLASELAGTPYSKTAHRRALMPKLSNRSVPSVEYKHANISAALLDLGFPYVDGYKPRSNYQALLREVVLEQLNSAPSLLKLASADADRPMVVPEIEDILSVFVRREATKNISSKAREPRPAYGYRLPTNYIELEARNRSLGDSGELFVLTYEKARLIAAGQERLAARIEHTSQVRGDHEGYDILSFEDNGAERLIEVKTTKYGSETPFYVTRNEVATSGRQSDQYQLYRLYSFRVSPRLYTIPGAIEQSCFLSAVTFSATPR